MLTLYILCGYPFAGKSTIARELIPALELTRVALDDINSERGVGGDVNSAMTEEEWQESYDMYRDRIVRHLLAGNSVIVDSVAHKRQNRDALRRLAEESSARTVVLHVATPASVARERWLDNRQSGRRVDVRDDDFNRVVDGFEVPEADESVIVVEPDLNSQQVLDLVRAVMG